jgi:propionyl-CoA carboxylase alpha chain
MIRIAAGERLPFAQHDIRHSGWAIEARLYAEDPLRNFLPSIGRLVRYQAPEGDGVRVDAGVAEGAEISLHYDPMIAKLICRGTDRTAAADRLADALDGFFVSGVRHNAGFLAAIATNERFRAGALSTDFIAEEFPNGFAPPAGFVAADRAILIAAALAEARLPPALVTAAVRTVLLDGQAHAVSIARREEGYAVATGGESLTVATDWLPGRNLMRFALDGRTVTIQVETLPARTFRLTHRGVTRTARVLPPRAAELLAAMPAKSPADTSRLVVSPMPGLLAALIVSEGQEVKAGEPLAIVEAMKMENVLRAERDGKVAKLCARAGDSLTVDQVILEFE